MIIKHANYPEGMLEKGDNVKIEYCPENRNTYALDEWDRIFNVHVLSEGYGIRWRLREHHEEYKMARKLFLPLERNLEDERYNREAQGDFSQSPPDDPSNIWEEDAFFEAEDVPLDGDHDDTMRSIGWGTDEDYCPGEMI